MDTAIHKTLSVDSTKAQHLCVLVHGYVLPRSPNMQDEH